MHPKFADLAALYPEQKGFPTEKAALEAMGTLEAEIVIAVVNQVKQGDGLLKPPALVTAQQP